MPIQKDGHKYHLVSENFGEKQCITLGYTMANYAVSRHSQEFYEINIITRGTGVHHFGEKEYPVSEGDVFIIPPEILHGYEGGDGFDVYHIILNPIYMQKNSSNLKRLPAYSTIFHIDPVMRRGVSADLHLRLEEGEMEVVRGYLVELEKLNRSKDRYTEDAILGEAMVTIIITKLCEAHTKQMARVEKNGEDKYFADTLSYIYEHYNESVDIDTLVRMARMSRTAYLTKFKRITGTTPGRFQSERRVEMAKQLLQNSSKTLGEIAVEVGCFDSPHLIRIFEKSCGMTPSKYRAALKKRA